MTDVSGLPQAEIRSYSFHDPSKAPTPNTGGTGPSPDVQALIGDTGPTMSDPALADRLAGLDIPVHVLWGESDRIVDPEYGKAYAAAIPSSVFTLMPAPATCRRSRPPRNCWARCSTSATGTSRPGKEKPS
jgi:pimeloyl-ACP methyl ester carboxylesterase